MKKIFLYIFSFLFITPVFSDGHNLEFIFSGTLNIDELNFRNDKFQIIKANGTSIITKSEIDSLPINSIQGKKCVFYSKVIDGESTLEGSCLIKDIDGDTISSFLIRKGVIGKAASGGEEVLTGLTGKYKGLSGKCTYNVKFVRNVELSGVTFNKCKISK